ncbi:Pentatricopeptide repeat-containing protein [Camellia lanceoleosa]|uniref:Pentatricopeptide repeat-containing protein n=1 Tax=Camellia lanceoleosa TaxID=1840588 RepID=A0ACC0G8Q5_9ERIC|nr:Pentatricopeptide repeat-containing protein [Camellia lanceoleosa]
MNDKGVSLDVVAYSSLIQGLCQQRRLTEAYDIFQEMWRSDLPPNECTYTTLINAYCAEGDIKNWYLADRYVVDWYVCRLVVDWYVSAWFVAVWAKAVTLAPVMLPWTIGSSAVVGSWVDLSVKIVGVHWHDDVQSHKSVAMRGSS